MTGRYDEWAAARSPALLRLAHALTDDEDTALRSCRRALQRTAGAWGRAAQGDPDLEVRRHLVRVCPSRDRAAAALRTADDLSDAQIADVLGCSESGARRHVRRGLAAAAEAGDRFVPGERYDAHQARVALLEPRAGEATRRRGRVTWAVVSAVLALVGGVAFVTHESRTPGGLLSHSRAVPRSWRHESYDGVEVQVPATWGWGGAPLRSDVFGGRDSLGACGAGTAAVQSAEDPTSYISAHTGFTGRPVALSHVCLPWGSDGIMPTGDALWFASPLPVGTKDVGPVVAETRAVGTQHVTVFSGDPVLRGQVLGTARAVDVDANGCPARAVLQPAGPAQTRPDAMSVCVYSQDTGTSVLLWSGEVSASGAQEYAAAVRAAAAGSGGGTCPSVPSGTWVALGLHGGSGTQWDLADLRCARLRGPDGIEVPLTPATVRAWAAGGVTAYVPAPAGATAALRPFFRTPSG